MIRLQLRVDDQRLLPGYSAGLGQATALVTVSVEGALRAGALGRIHTGAVGLIPEQPLFGVAEGDWPAVFLVDPAGGDDDRQLAQWVVGLTVALQRWARDPVWRGRVLGAGGGRLQLAIPWQRDGVLNDTLRLALRLIELWATPPAGGLPDVNAAIRQGMSAAQQDGVFPNDMRCALAALERGIPVELRQNHLLYGWGARAERMRSTLPGRTSYIAGVIAQNKMTAARLLREADLPVPRGEVVADLARALEVAAGLGWPVVVKPVNQEQGRGVATGIGDAAGLHTAFAAADGLSPGAVLVEEHVDGDDHRLLVVKGRLVAAARRVPGGVTGDGVHTVGELVERLNADPRRGDDPRSLLMRLTVDGEALDLLARQGLMVAAVPAAGRFVALRRTANISTGGTSEDVTARVHPDNRRLAERAARLVGLDIAGVDFLTTDIGRSWREAGGAICEVNAQPGMRPHWLADPTRDVNGEIIDALFAGRPARIPTAAITGTNGKSTTALMLHHIWTAAGRVAGVCTTTYVRVGDHIVSTGNLSGFPGARLLLADPAVEAAIIEMPRKGLIRFGHPCDRYDVAALLNVADDHLGVDGIDTLDQLAELKSEVLQRASGAVVVNAEDHRCVAMLARAGTSRHILVARDPGAVAGHRSAGGQAVVLAEHEGQPWIVFCEGDSQTPLMPVNDIPATMNGLLRVNQSNAMFAAAIAWAQGVDLQAVRSGLASFHNSVEQNPGRYNFLEGFPFQVLLDYGHNPDGVRELCAVAGALPVNGRRILCTTGFANRHAGHFSTVAATLGDTFDLFVIGCDLEWIRMYAAFGGDHSAETALAFKRNALLENGVPADRVITEEDRTEALLVALALAEPDDLLVIQAEPHHALKVIDERFGRDFSASRTPPPPR